MASPDSVTRHSVGEFLSLCSLIGPVGHVRGTGPCPPSLPLLDTRSPGEFRQGHIPGAVNLPLFSDAERADVGTVYKQEGREAALLRGLAHVGPRMEQIAAKALELAKSGELAMYCSRGGMRSGSLAWLFSFTGLRVQVLDTGYKSFRRYVLDLLQHISSYRLLVLGGRTGSGKTEVLHRMAGLGAQVLDLEALACHRGSAFGALPGEPQPTCEHFENLLAMALAWFDPAKPVWVEDECENLGTVNLPRAFFSCLRASPLAILEVPQARRQKRVLADYGGIAPDRMGEYVDRIRKRLGGLEHKRAHAALAEGDLPALAGILLDYYDRAYAKQLRSRTPFAVVEAQEPEEAAGRLLEIEAPARAQGAGG